jgi:hypothetical protein
MDFFQFEGPYRDALKKEQQIVNNVHLFLPYNPKIVLFGATEQRKQELISMYPQGRIGEEWENVDCVEIYENVLATLQQLPTWDFKVIHVKTDMTTYPEIKWYLEMKGFGLLSHWYGTDGQGEATFIERRMYDALFY